MGLSDTTSYDGMVYGSGLALFVVVFFLLVLFCLFFGTPLTEEDRKAYLKENFPVKYEELIKQEKSTKDVLKELSYG